MPAPHGRTTRRRAHHRLDRAASACSRSNGLNLRLDLPIALYEAVLGAKVRVPTLDGAVELAVPANTSSGPHVPSQGQRPSGKPRRRSLCTAAHRVAGGKDAELEELMTKWRNEKHTIRARHGLDRTSPVRSRPAWMILQSVPHRPRQIPDRACTDDLLPRGRLPTGRLALLAAVRASCVIITLYSAHDRH